MVNANLQLIEHDGHRRIHFDFFLNTQKWNRTDCLFCGVPLPLKYLETTCLPGTYDYFSW